MGETAAAQPTAARGTLGTVRNAVLLLDLLSALARLTLDLLRTLLELLRHFGVGLLGFALTLFRLRGLLLPGPFDLPGVNRSVGRFIW